MHVCQAKTLGAVVPPSSACSDRADCVLPFGITSIVFANSMAPAALQEHEIEQSRVVVNGSEAEIQNFKACRLQRHTTTADSAVSGRAQLVQLWLEGSQSL